MEVGVVTIDVLSIGIKFENFVQAGCRDLGSHHGCTMYCRKPIIMPKLVTLFWNIFRIANTPFHYLCPSAYCILVFDQDVSFRTPQSLNFYNPTNGIYICTRMHPFWIWHVCELTHRVIEKIEFWALWIFLFCSFDLIFFFNFFKHSYLVETFLFVDWHKKPCII